MTYGLYSTQLARAWTQRIEKENALADRFWSQQVKQEVSDKAAMTQAMGGGGERPGTAASKASSSAPSGFTSKTSFLKNRLERLEMELSAERESRMRVEGDLQDLRQSTQRLEEAQQQRLATPRGGNQGQSHQGHSHQGHKH